MMNCPSTGPDPSCGGKSCRVPRSFPGLQVLRSGQVIGEATMAKGEQRGNREAKKPKKAQTKVTAAAPSRFLEVAKGTTPPRPAGTKKS